MRRARVAARLAVTTAPEELTEADLIGLAHRTPYRGIGLALIVSGDRAVVTIWHAVADGASACDLLHRLVEVACGLPDPPWPRPVRFPVLRAALRAGPGSVARLRAWRRDHPGPRVDAAPPTVAQRERRRVVVDSRLLDAATLDRVRATAPDGTSVNACLTALAGRIAAPLYRESDDPAVMIPVGLRPWASGPLEGNFFWVPRLGGLRSTDWTPAVVERFFGEARSDIGVAALLGAMCRVVLARVGRRAADGGRGEIAMQVSCIRSPRAFPAEAWRSGDPTVRFGTTGPWPHSFFVMLWRIEDRMIVNVWDDTDAFDAADFLPAFLAALPGAPARAA